MLICPHCRNSVAENSALAGQLLLCPHCMGSFQSPAIPAMPLAPLQPLAVGSSVAVSLRNRPRRPSVKQSPLLAVFLSFLLPGLGQLTQGRTVEGMAFMIGALLAACLTIFMWPAFFIGLIVLVWSMIDAGSH